LVLIQAGELGREQAVVLRVDVPTAIAPRVAGFFRGGIRAIELFIEGLVGWRTIGAPLDGQRGEGAANLLVLGAGGGKNVKAALNTRPLEGVYKEHRLGLLEALDLHLERSAGGAAVEAI